MNQYDPASSLAWLAFSSFICVESLPLPLWFLREPSPGFLPLLVGVLLAGLSALSFVQAQAGSSADGKSPSAASDGRIYYGSSLPCSTTLWPWIPWAFCSPPSSGLPFPLRHGTAEAGLGDCGKRDYFLALGENTHLQRGERVIKWSTSIPGGGETMGKFQTPLSAR